MKEQELEAMKDELLDLQAIPKDQRTKEQTTRLEYLSEELDLINDLFDLYHS